MAIGIGIAISIFDEDRDRDRDLNFDDRAHALIANISQPLQKRKKVI